MLKDRKIIRSKNIIGDLGEKIAIDIYNNTPGETNLQLAPQGTKNVDALSRKGERYSIKTVRYPNRSTGVIYGLEPPNSRKKDEIKFEYLVIVTLDDCLQPIKILEIAWEKFLQHKKWHSRARAWNLYIGKELESVSRVVFTT